MVDYAEAFKRPFLDVKKLFAGTFILLGFFAVLWGASFLVILSSTQSILALAETNAALPEVSMLPLIFLYVLSILLFSVPTGFFARFGLNAAKKSFEIPSWKNFGALFRDGFFLSVLLWAYSAPIFLVNYLLFGVNQFSLSFSPEAQEAFLGSILERPLLYMPLLLAVYLLYMYILPIVMLSFMETGNFAGGFRLDNIFKKAFTLKYLGSWILSIAVTLGLGIILLLMILILAFTVIGIPLLIIAVPMFFYVLLLIVSSIYGQAYGEIDGQFSIPVSRPKMGKFKQK